MSVPANAQGNRIAQARGKDQKIRTDYCYNVLNQLTDIKFQDTQTSYAYDSLGRRITKASKDKRTDFLWMEDVLLSESNYTTTPEAAPAELSKKEKLYLFEPGTFKPLAFVQDEQVYHYHLDHLGTPQEISDANGDVVWAVSYKAYGDLAIAFEQSIENNIRFQGQYFDVESGLHYNRFRYYDPGCGRFVNQDPIGLAGGNNNYQYVSNPTQWVDPLGLSSFDPFAVGEITDFPEGLNFGQDRIAPNFSSIGSQADSSIAGRSISDVASDMKAGSISPDSLVISYTIDPVTGKPVTLNNRGLAVIIESGKQPANAIRVPYEEVPPHLVKDIKNRPPSRSINVTANKDGSGVVRKISSDCDL